MKKNKIIFTPIEDIDPKYYPIPARKNIPEWFKKTTPYLNGQKDFDVTLQGFNNLTIKKCIPVFDALTAGYIIKTHVDVFVRKNEDNFSEYIWPQFNPIEFHPFDQVFMHPSIKNNTEVAKWTSPWAIQTPKGYSSLFIPPMHNPNKIFTIFPGIVDTDTYSNPVNLSFLLDDPNFTGIIPAGTDICQVIPFKREQYSMEIGNEKKSENVKKSMRIYYSRFVSNYKNNFWNKKYYQ